MHSWLKCQKANSSCNRSLVPSKNMTGKTRRRNNKMSKIFTIDVKWTNLTIGLMLLCAVFSFSAMAQADGGKPLDAKTLAALVAELKGVVARTATEPGESEMVARKWDARRDLAGKTKLAVINLLFQDVKLSVKDSGTQYQISSMFGMYKQMPDDAIKAETPSATGDVSKLAAVNKLVDLTYRKHPYVGIEETLNALPGAPDDQAAVDKAREGRIAGFEEALKVNNQLTSAQKSFVRTNYDFLEKLVDSAIATAISKNFPTERWIKEGLQKSYTSRFTSTELSSLIAYLQGKAGKRVLEYIRTMEMWALIVKNGGTTTGFTKAEKAEHNRFVATPLGKKFITAYLQETIAYEESRENEVRSANPDADGSAIYRPENLNKLINKFVADNYKK